MLAITSPLIVSRFLIQHIIPHNPYILQRVLIRLRAALGCLLYLRPSDAIRISRPASLLCDNLFPILQRLADMAFANWLYPPKHASSLFKFESQDTLDASWMSVFAAPVLTMVCQYEGKGAWFNG